jgi:acylphosphatase
MVRRRVIVHGRVQGVFFRDTVRRRAELLGVAGSVANRPDGTVEAVFEGDDEDIAVLVDFCGRGPDRARVERTEVFEEEPRGDEGFRIL